MSRLVIVCEKDDRELFRRLGIQPWLVSTDIDNFIATLPYLEDVRIVIIFSGCCLFQVPKVADCINKLLVSNVIQTTTIESISVLSNFKLDSFIEYYLYQGYNIRDCIKYKRGKKVGKNIDVFMQDGNSENYETIYVDGIAKELENAKKTLRDTQYNSEYYNIQEYMKQSM